ncbi:MAG: CapA family protein [Calditrichia bacterium]
MPANERPLTIVAGGDVMLGSWVEDVVRREGMDYPFRAVDSLLQDADLVIANLEAPFGVEDSAAYEKSYTFQVNPDLVAVLKAGRINAVSLANNHILDFGFPALQYTMNLLNEHQIRFAGAGLDLQGARQPAIIESNGSRIAFAAYSLTFPEEFWATDSTPGTCFPHHTFLYDDIRRFKKENDVVIISFHWGSEKMDVPKKYQKQLARSAVRAGADLILGHHPHVVQGLEIYQGKLIAYSLGNYVFGSYSESASESMLLKIFLGTRGISRCKIYPISVYNKEVEFQPQLLQGEKKTEFLNKLQNLSAELNNNTDVISSTGWIKLL